MSTPDNPSHPTRFELADQERVRRWFTDNADDLLIGTDYEPASDTYSDGPINTILDAARQHGIITGPSGWQITFHYALDEDATNASIMWTIDHPRTPLSIASNWEPISCLDLDSHRGVDAVHDVLEAAVTPPTNASTNWTPTHIADQRTQRIEAEFASQTVRLRMCHLRRRPAVAVNIDPSSHRPVPRSKATYRRPHHQMEGNDNDIKTKTYAACMAVRPADETKEVPWPP